MTEYDWAQIRADTIRAFGGDAPRNELEQRIIDVFREQPQLVVNTISLVTHGYQAGKVRSPWAILDINLREATRPGANITATDTTEKQRAIQRAEQWVRAAGVHFDSEDEVVLELFDTGKQLHAYAQVTLERQPDKSSLLTEPKGDAALVSRIRQLWRELRPIGEQSEADALQRAEEWKTQQADLQKALKEAAITPEPRAAFATPANETYFEPEPVAATTASDDDIPF
jgi:hypothetical protein